MHRRYSLWKSICVHEKGKGFNEVYQLNGGIIEYARQIKELGIENKFKGKNFVFDERLGERISEEIISKCHQCGAPCDTHTNCLNDQCHILFIQCPECREKYQSCCSRLCSEFHELRLPKKKTFEKAKLNSMARSFLKVDTKRDWIKHTFR